jgi:hypothetical protein
MKHALRMASAFILCSSLSVAHADTQTLKINDHDGSEHHFTSDTLTFAF